MNTDSKSDLLFQTIQSRILSGSLTPGSLLLEQQVAEEFYVGRQTARETLKRLCQEHYLKSFPRKGYLVTGITPEECRQIQCLRYQLESYAIRLAASQASLQSLKKLDVLLHETDSSSDPRQTANYRFHMALSELSENPYLVSTLRPLLLDVCRYAITPLYGGTLPRTESCHCLILTALKDRDADLACRYLKDDLGLTTEIL